MVSEFLILASDSSNPVILGSYDLGLRIYALLGLFLLIAALATIFFGRRATTAEKLVWTIVSIVLPYLGPILWLVIFFSKGKSKKPTKNAV